MKTLESIESIESIELVIGDLYYNTYVNKFARAKRFLRGQDGRYSILCYFVGNVTAGAPTKDSEIPHRVWKHTPGWKHLGPGNLSDYPEALL